jgi:hypothetical protein
MDETAAEKEVEEEEFVDHIIHLLYWELNKEIHSGSDRPLGCLSWLRPETAFLTDLPVLVRRSSCRIMSVSVSIFYSAD